MKKNKLLWTILFIVIAVFSVLAVIAQNRNFSLSAFFHTIKSASLLWLCAAIFSMVANIMFEALALIYICNAFGYRSRTLNGFFYSSADIYFSAITPSATGGQPACAYLMMKDGIPGATATAALLLNLMMYTVSLVILGLISIIATPGVFRFFRPISGALIGVGCLLQLGLTLIFYLLLYKDSMLHQLCSRTLLLLHRFRLIGNLEEKQESLSRTMGEYRNCSQMLKGQGALLFKVLSLNVLQRVAQIGVTVFTFLSMGGVTAQAVAIGSLQSFVVIGAYCVPIPGAMGVTDYLMLDGFGSMMTMEEATHLELLSRSLSFYFCILICGVAVILKYYLLQRRKLKP
ncbi:MAG: flippase-like domain-containing protein [Firmicutes bacterium]|nr:flippase-like domain-containing protein [Bacillota bacterium]